MLCRRRYVKEAKVRDERKTAARAFSYAKCARIRKTPLSEGDVQRVPNL